MQEKNYGSISEEFPQVDTRCGRVRGYRLRDVAVFSGIPYGEPPTGHGRFRAPEPVRSWTGIKDCLAPGHRAYQPEGSVFSADNIGEYFSGKKITQEMLRSETPDENCLVLNVLTPGLTETRRPVMVYIHGGGFSTGSGMLALGGDSFVRENDVVLVSVNHRLGLMGYLYLGDFSEKYLDSGMAGMLDLVLALRWVQDNICAFGGNPDNVTIFGESGGGCKVSMLMAMPEANGLFHKAIVQSGSLRMYNQCRAEGTQQARAYLQALGISPEDLSSLETMPIDKLYRPELGALDFAPTADGIHLPENLDSALWTANPAAKNIPLLVGSCEDEESIFLGEDVFAIGWDEALTRLRRDGIGDKAAERLLAAYRQAAPDDDAAHVYIRIVSDLVFGLGTLEQADARAGSDCAPVYRYLFTYDTPMQGRKYGAFHTADLPLEMRMVAFPECERLSRQMASAWASFARCGNPATAELPWPAYDLQQRATMIFDRISGAQNDPDRLTRSAWE